MLSSVDLPQPDGPITATNSPLLELEVDAVERRRLELGRAIALRDSAIA